MNKDRFSIIPKYSISNIMAILYRPKVVLNRILTKIVFFLTKKNCNADWLSIKIINHRQIFIGNNFSAGRGLWLEAVSDGELIIGEGVNVSDWVHIGAFNRIEIGNGVLIGSKVIITDHSHGNTSCEMSCEFEIPPNCREIKSSGPIKIGENVWIGDNVVVLSGVTIGDGAIVGANSVINKDIPPYTVAVGSPAKVISRIV